jgi:hypothetical protein
LGVTNEIPNDRLSLMRITAIPLQYFHAIKGILKVKHLLNVNKPRYCIMEDRKTLFPETSRLIQQYFFFFRGFHL